MQSDWRWLSPKDLDVDIALDPGLRRTLVSQCEGEQADDHADGKATGESFKRLATRRHMQLLQQG